MTDVSNTDTTVTSGAAIVSGTDTTTSGTVVTSSGGPTTPSVVDDINAKVAELGITSPIVYPVDNKFTFRKVKDELGTETRRPTVLLTLPMPTVDGILAALKDEKQRDYLLEIVGSAVIESARQQVNDETKPVNKQEDLDTSKLTLAYLANVPKAERRGGGIPKTLWEAFEKDYISVMPAIASKTEEQVTKAAKIFVAKLQPAKTNKPVITLLMTQLDLWFAGTTEGAQEEFMDIYEFLKEKGDTFLGLTDEDLTKNL